MRGARVIRKVQNLPYVLCLFDLDGTLTDPLLGITRAFQHAMSRFGIDETTENLKRFIGPPLRESFRGRLGFSEADTERAVAYYREYFADIGIFENTVYPEVPDILQRLIDGGKTLAVATSKVTVYTNRILEHFDLRRFFGFVSGDEMDGSKSRNGKRDIVRIALERLDPGRGMAAVMIGDRKHDIIGARENGIDSIGVLWGYGSRDELESAGAKHIAETPEGMYRLL